MILITGANGVVGRQVMKQLIHEGFVAEPMLQTSVCPGPRQR
ncbi:FlaA1/EpsC-like NDP-sugar epimerase [Streptomyces luteogriseus]|uniref:FlaA1/EpsC-like NDP-sugar epimerase n=1 Tax=Streptomyces luteogriseus TaxID=68233 RepID=A0A7W7DQY8_9ACTN|nr:FlaA1/EpsC-like NDP-sugar epimerase [Streptomyces luteogriseus]